MEIVECFSPPKMLELGFVYCSEYFVIFSYILQSGEHPRCLPSHNDRNHLPDSIHIPKQNGF